MPKVIVVHNETFVSIDHPYKEWLLEPHLFDLPNNNVVSVTFNESWVRKTTVFFVPLALSI
jgi:hypothetical protein